MRNLWFCLVLLLVPVWAGAVTLELGPGEQVLLTGEVFYSEPMKFDYDKDGTVNTVVMGATLFIKVTADGMGEGYIERYLYDTDLNKAVTWYFKQNMLSEPPIGTQRAVSDVSWKDREVKFKSGGWIYTVSDGGKGYTKDTIMVSDGVKEHKVVMYGGDVTVHELNNNTGHD